MAGSGYKKFNAGSVLTASDVQGYLADQAVQVYASASARTSALGSAVAAGMVSYRADGTVVEYYNGSTWVNLIDSTDSAANPNWYALNADRALSPGSATTQSLLGVGYPMAAGSTYEVELIFDTVWTQTTNSGLGVSVAFNYSGTLTSQFLRATFSHMTAPATPNTTISEQYVNTTTSGNLFQLQSNASSGTYGDQVVLRGIIRTNAAGTYTPQIYTGNSNTGSIVVRNNSFMRINYLGSNTATNFSGGWA